MSNIKKTLEQYPDISFINNLTVEELLDGMIADFQEKYLEETGIEISLKAGDPNKIILNAAALQIYQGFQYIERAGRNSYLKYAYGTFLDNLGAMKGVYRSDGENALTTIRFTTSQLQAGAIVIPKGTRCTAGDNVYFSTIEMAELKSGMEYVDVPAVCMEAGNFANGYEVGQINILVDPIPYINSVANIMESDGGTDMESDESLAERIYLAPAEYSTAGPVDAYESLVKKVNSEISDVKVSSPEGGTVDIRFMMNNGEVPSEQMINKVLEALSDKKVRPLTDLVKVSQPGARNYNVRFTYWIEKENSDRIEAIQEEVLNAVKAYELWQGEKIGRNICPDVLIAKIINAGAVKVKVDEPAEMEISDTEIAILLTEDIVYGGIYDG